MSDLERLAHEYHQHGYESNGYPEALEAKVERLTAAIARFVYANDTEVSDDRPITPEAWEAAWERAMDGLRAALAADKGE